jgi:hypothetical protein
MPGGSWGKVERGDPGGYGPRAGIAEVPVAAGTEGDQVSGMVCPSPGAGEDMVHGEVFLRPAGPYRTGPGVPGEHIAAGIAPFQIARIRPPGRIGRVAALHLFCQTEEPGGNRLRNHIGILGLERSSGLDA